MDIAKIKTALQDLITRLKDAEDGFDTIADHTEDKTLAKWCRSFAADRHNMHLELQELSESLGGDPEVSSTVLGQMHKMFINFKLNFVDSDIPGLVEEIERGAKVLIKDYEKALKDVEMPTNIVSKLISQKTTVEVELQRLLDLKKEYTRPKT
ncbi:ferritin-like domain-containing protein [Portibacter marinus]|uniref:ferritin-like domain-containing protein n=1 Tax=Portibacter marinus TaxID=2898660 RepID=UPI001F2E5802|nr:PA2169 family four-helix-bundle protein [Portibacter marinus]